MDEKMVNSSAIIWKKITQNSVIIHNNNSLGQSWAYKVWNLHAIMDIKKWKFIKLHV